MNQTNLLRDLLRVITPEEASDLISVGDKVLKEALTDLLVGHNKNRDVDHDAKILNFPDIANENIKPEHDGEIRAGKNVHQFINQFITKVLFESSKVHPGAKAVETSTFILNEKERFKSVYTRLKGKEVLDLYAKNSVVDLEQERKNRKDLSRNSSTGVLVNKKHY